MFKLFEKWFPKKPIYQKPDYPLFKPEYYFFTADDLCEEINRVDRQFPALASMIGLASQLFLHDENNHKQIVLFTIPSFGLIEITTKYPVSQETKNNVDDYRPVGCLIKYKNS